MNIFQDKRIAFSDIQYNMKSQIAVLHWNENVDREFTSIWNPRTNRAPRQTKEKNYKAMRSKYRKNIWNLYMRSMFEKASGKREQVKFGARNQTTAEARSNSEVINLNILG
ncbi:hypothetical protein DPMN_028038, partial [Dreissena polymorpha]